MLGRQISRKVTRNIGYQVGRLGWSLGTGSSAVTISAIFATPSYLAYGTNMVANGDYFFTANSANNRITGDISIVIDSMLNDWTPTNPNIFVAKDESTVGTRSYSYNVNASYPHFNFSLDGTNLIGYDANAALPFTNGQRYHHGVYRNPTTGEIKFFYSLDHGVTWTQLGTTITGTTGNIYAGTAPLTFGNRSSLTYLLDGNIYDSELYTGNIFEAPGSAVLKVDFDPVDWRSGNSWKAVDTGELWMLTGYAKIARLYQQTISFDSSIAGISRVEYGTTSGVYPWSVNSSTIATSHSLTIGSTGGLDDAVTYYYRVGVSVDGGSTWTYSPTQQLLPPVPVANIAQDDETLPATYNTAGNGYWPISSTQDGYTGITTYEGYAPHSVFFMGYNSSPINNIKTHEWDFGAGSESDYGGRYFKGANAAHVYETPGTYVVTLTVTDRLGRTSTSTRTVTVKESGAGSGLGFNLRQTGSITASNASTAITGTSTAFTQAWVGAKLYNSAGTTLVGTVASVTDATHLTLSTNSTINLSSAAINAEIPRVTYYVDATSGNDTNDGLTTGTAWQTFAKVIAMLRKNNGSSVATWPLKPGDKVLLKRGETFSISGLITTFYHGQMVKGIHIGTYGTGNKPIVQWTGTANPNTENILINASGFGSGFVTFSDIQFNMNNPGVHAISSVWYSLASSRNITLLRCYSKDHFNSIVQTANGDLTYMTQRGYGTFIIGCSADQATIASTATALGYSGGATALALIGNTFDQSGNHINYLGNPQNTVIADNVFTRPAFGRTALRVTGGPLNAPGERIYVARNKLLGWVDPVSQGPGAHNGGGTRYNYQISNLSHNSNASWEEHINDVIYEDNIITNFEGGLSITNLSRLTLRNNIYVSPSQAPFEIIKIGDPTTFQKRPSDNIRIINNAFVFNGASSATAAPCIRVHGTTGTGVGYHPGLVIKNNVMISVSGRTDIPIKFEVNNASQLADVVSNNNLLDSASATWADVAGTLYNLGSWQSATGGDTSSLTVVAGVVTPPTPVSHLPGFPDSSAACVAEADAYVTAFRLDTGSAAIDAGDDLVYRYTDYDGNPAPVGAHQDIGAFEKQ